jgi:hypothetical protein
MGTNPSHYQNYRAMSRRNNYFPAYAQFAERTSNGPGVNHFARLHTKDSVDQALTPHEMLSSVTNMGMMANAVNIAREATNQLGNLTLAETWTAAEIIPIPGPVITQIVGSSEDIVIYEQLAGDDGTVLDPSQHQVYSGLPLPTGRYLRESCDDALPLLNAATSVEYSSSMTDASSIEISTRHEELLSPSKRRRTSPRKLQTDLEHYDKMQTRSQICRENRHALAQISAELNGYARPKRSSPAAQSRSTGFHIKTTRFSPRSGKPQDAKTHSRQIPRRDHHSNNTSRRRLLPDAREEDGDC